jgi:hypothetical protein
MRRGKGKKRKGPYEAERKLRFRGASCVDESR